MGGGRRNPPSVLSLHPSRDETLGSVAFHQVLQPPFQMDAKYQGDTWCQVNALPILTRTLVEMKQGKTGCGKGRKNGKTGNEGVRGGGQ